MTFGGWLGQQISQNVNANRIGDTLQATVDPSTYSLSNLKDKIVQGFENLNLIGLATNEYWKYTHPGVPNVPNPSLSANVLLNQTGNVVKVPIVYGTRRVGGIHVMPPYVNGNDLYCVMVLCEGPISAINTVYIDGIASTDAKFTTSSPSLVHIIKYTGTTTQAANTELITALGSPSLWTSAHQLKGLAYIVVKLTYDPDVFNALPQITADVDGKLVKDIRNSPQAAVFSSNPALCIRDYLTNTIYGKGLSESLIDDTLLAAAANTCDTNIVETTASPQVNITQFACNVVLNTENSIKDNLNILLSSCHGFISYYGGTYNLRIEQDETPVYDFTTDNIVGSISVSNGGKADRLNRLKVIYTNPDQNYADDTYVYDSSSLRTADNGAILEKEITLSAEINQYRAQWHSSYFVKRSRKQITVQLTGTPEALRCVPGDIVTLTYASLGWTGSPAKKFRVMSMSLRMDCLIDISLIEHDSTIYDRTIPPENAAISETTFPNPNYVYPPTGVTVNTGAIYNLTLNDETVINRIYLTWTASVDIFLSFYEVRYKVTSETEWHSVGKIPKGDTAVYINGVKDNTNYTVEIRAVNSIGTTSIWANDTGDTIALDYWSKLKFVEGTISSSGELWKDMASDDAGNFCAIGYDLPTGKHFATSSDGQTWAIDSLPTSYAVWTGIAWNGSVFCIVGQGGGAGTDLVVVSSDPTASPNGWTSYSIGISPIQNWVSIAALGSLFCAIGTSVGGGATNVGMISSDDGATWSPITLSYSSSAWHTIVSNGTVLCAVGGSASASISSDGSSWTTKTISATSRSWRSSAANANCIVIVAYYNDGATALGQTVTVSNDDGATWTEITLPLAAKWSKIAWNGYVFLIASEDNTSCLIGSADGKVWKIKTLPYALIGALAAGGPNGDIFAAMGTDTTVSPISSFSHYSSITDTAPYISSINHLFIQDGTGAVPTDTQTRGRMLINATDHGATGDGTTDDSTNIQSINDYAESVGGAVWFPYGYTFKINNVNQTVPWYSQGAILKPVGGASMDMIVVGGASYTSTDIVLEGFIFIVTDIGATYSIGCIRTHSCNSLRINNCSFIDGNFYDIYASGGSDTVSIGDVIVTNCLFSSTTGNTINSWAGHYPVEWHPNAADGVTTRPCRSFIFKNNVVYGKWQCKYINTDHVEIDSIFIHSAAFTQFGSSAVHSIEGVGNAIFGGTTLTKQTTAFLNVQSSPGNAGVTATFAGDKFVWKHHVYDPDSTGAKVQLLDIPNSEIYGGYIPTLEIGNGAKTKIDIIGANIGNVTSTNLAGVSDTIDEINIIGGRIGYNGGFNIYSSTWTGYVTTMRIGGGAQLFGISTNYNRVQVTNFIWDNVYANFSSTGLGGGFYIYCDGTSDAVKINGGQLLTNSSIGFKINNAPNSIVDGVKMTGANLSGVLYDVSKTGTTTLTGRRRNIVNEKEFQSGAGAPSGSVTPRDAEDRYFDTSGSAWYLATGTANTNWTSAIS